MDSVGLKKEYKKFWGNNHGQKGEETKEKKWALAVMKCMKSSNNKIQKYCLQIKDLNKIIHFYFNKETYIESSTQSWLSHENFTLNTVVRSIERVE